MKKIITSIFALFLIVQLAFAQQNVPIIKASSVKVAIKDGDEGITKYWYHLEKSKFPIVYDLAKNQGARQVTFYTDMDSISFEVASNKTYPFKVILNQKDTVSILLSTITPEYSRFNTNNSVDTFSFTVNNNKQIILKGSINDRPEIDFVFDLGARITYLIGNNLADKNQLILDGHMEDESVSGLSTEKTSSRNTLKFGNIKVENTPICYIDAAGFLGNGGGLIGFNIFQGKIVEIDFDKQLLLIHTKLPQKSSDYAPIDFKQTTGGMYIPITLNNGSKECTGWYFFDTGADFPLSLDARFATKEQLYNTMKKMGSTGIASSGDKVLQVDNLLAPFIKIANFQIPEVPVLLGKETYAEAAFEDGVIGIGLQKRFNMIIDYPTGKMYLKPNQYFKDTFKKKENNSNIMIGIAIAFGLWLMGFLMYKKRKLA